MLLAQRLQEKLFQRNTSTTVVLKPQKWQLSDKNAAVHLTKTIAE